MSECFIRDLSGSRMMLANLLRLKAIPKFSETFPNFLEHLFKFEDVLKVVSAGTRVAIVTAESFYCVVEAQTNISYSRTSIQPRLVEHQLQPC